MAKKLRIKKFILTLSTLTFASTQILLFTLLPLLSERLGLSLSTVVATFSLGSFLFVWGAPYWASKSDHVGRSPVMAWTLAGLVLSTALLMALMNLSLSPEVTLGALILSRLVYGLVASGIVPVAQLAQLDLAQGHSKISSLFSHSLTLNLGRALGPALLLLFKNDFEVLLISLTIWTMALLLFNQFINIPQPLRSVERPIETNWPQVAKLLWLPLVLTLLFATYTGILHSSLGNTLKQTFSLTGLEASTLMARVLLLGSFVMVLTQVLGKLLLKNQLRLVLVLGMISLATGATVFAFINSYAGVWTGIALISAGIALIYPGHLAIVHHTYAKESMGRNIGLLSSGNTIGYAIGGGLTSLLLDVNINKVALCIVALLSVVAFITCQRVKYAS